MTRAYTEYGDRRNPAILFLHGIRLGRDIWTQHARALVDRYHVVALDLPGHGALANVPFTQSTIAASVNDTIANVCSAPPLIVGYSLGGYVAMEYVVRHAERTRGLLLAGCTLDFEGWKHWPYEASSRLAEFVPSVLLERMLQFTLHLTLPKSWAELVSPIPFNRDVLTRTSAISRDTRFSDKLVRYAKPVLFVNGEFDLVFRMDERRFLSRVPQARLRIIRRTDHTAPMRRAQEFTGIVRDFADRVFAASPA